MFSIVSLIILLVAVFGSAAMVAFIAWVVQRVNALEAGGLEGPAQLEKEVERLGDELLIMQDEVARLTEKVEFTEKLLSPPEEPDEGRDRCSSG